MTANEMADRNEWACCAYSKEVSAMLRQQQAEIEALKKAIVEYADCVDSVEGTDFISHLKYMGTSEESIALLYKLNGYDENGLWIHKEKVSDK